MNIKHFKLLGTTVFSLLLLFASAGSAQDGDGSELLLAEEAFAHSAEIVGNELVSTWTVAEGYYMYEDKFAVVSKTDDLQVGDIILPPGKVKDDPLFGRVTVYLDTFQARTPLHADSLVLNPSFEVWGQGCNEPIGVCYPPIMYEVSLPFTFVQKAEAQNAVQAESSLILDNLSLSSLADGSDDFLDVDEAFKFSAYVADGEAVHAIFEIAEGYYLYKDKFKFETSGRARTGRLHMPEAVLHEDQYYGVQEIYPSDIEIVVDLVRDSNEAGNITFTAEYQGCANEGICYAPTTKTVNFTLEKLDSRIESVDNLESQSLISEMKPFWWLILSAFGTGLLLTFTPCVLPLIPVLSSIIAGQKQSTGKVRGGFLAIAYVAGTVTTYALMGALAGATGDQLQAYFQNIWAIGTLSVIFVVMSMSMFGLFEIRLPSALETRMSEGTSRLGGGKMWVVYLLGIASALIVGACVSPLLISVLGVAIAQGSPILGAVMMSSMALGMGVVLIAVGFGIESAVPKSGAWMEKVKHVSGVMLLGVAIYLLSFIPEVPVLLLWSVLLIVTAIYLGATQALSPGASGWSYLWKGLGTVMLIWGILALVGGIYGNRDILRPLPELATIASGTGISEAVTSSRESSSIFTKVSSVEELDNILQTAKADGKPVLIDFYAEWCLDCIRLKKTTFKDPEVVAPLVERFVSVEIDVTDTDNDAGREIRKRYGIFGPPAMVFFDASGNRREDLTNYGYVTAKELLALLNQV